ncbi:hypothetical protein ACP70R_007818 [Stipagrostis hirtigluma subsp. patula]
MEAPSSASELKNVVVAEAGAGGIADTAAPEGEKKRTKVVRVKQGYIDCVLRQQRTARPYPVLSDETIAKLHSKPEDQERLRSLHAQAMALTKKMQDEDADILHQYRTKGYAVQEIEIGDVDDDEDDDGCGGEEAEVATAGVVSSL